MRSGNPVRSRFVTGATAANYVGLASARGAVLKRVGWDVNANAVRVAVFSLYVSLLEEVSPPEIRALISRGKLLPELWRETLVPDPSIAEATLTNARQGSTWTLAS